MTNALSRLLTQKGYLLADGATGTNLFNMGLMSGDAPELWNETQPKNILKLHQGAVDAGSDLFLTNSFGGNSIMPDTAHENCRAPPPNWGGRWPIKPAGRSWLRDRSGQPATSWPHWVH